MIFYSNSGATLSRDVMGTVKPQLRLIYKPVADYSLQVGVSEADQVVENCVLLGFREV
jgi:hypothetical protein